MSRRFRSPSSARGSALLLTLLFACGDGGTGPDDPVPSSILIVPAVATLESIGDSVRLVATVRDQHGEPLAGMTVGWTSASDVVATVTADGWVVAAAAGTVSIRATAGALTSDASVTVGQVAATVTLTVPDDTLAEGESVLLAAVVADANGVPIPGAAVTWASSDNAIATVDAGGRATAVRGAAPVTITATSGTASAAAGLAVLGKIVFQSDRGGNDEIYLMNTDGSGVTSLTSSAAGDQAPRWSPDGERIVFVSERDGNGEIYVMNADGTGLMNLTNTTADERVPAWSPDGARIAFAGNRDGNGEIYAMNADGSNVMRLTNDPGFDYAPAWSPDGSRIVFDSDRDGSSDLYVLNADGSGSPVQVTETTAPDGNVIADWSPDGSRIAFTGTRGADVGIWVMNADGTGATDVTPGTVEDVVPRWTPDGRLLFASTRDGNLEVYVMNADGSEQVRITDNPATDGVAAAR